MKKIKLQTKNLTVTAMMIPVIAVCAQIAVPFSAVPMTLQTFAVCLTGMLLGPTRGLAAVFVYLAMGAVGLPVFAGFSGSLAAVTGPTGGFLVGFLALVLFSAFTAKRGSAVPMLAIGLILCHLTGTLWFSYVSGTKFSSALLIVSLPYLWKDALSCFFSYILASRLKKHLH